MIIKNTIPLTGKPDDEREEKETAVYRLLDRLEIGYSRLDHEHADTIADCEEIEKYLKAKICKNLFLCNSQKTAFYLLMMPGDKAFRTKDLSHQINSARLSFAPPEYLLEYLNITPGAVSVMGLMNDIEHHVRLICDYDLLQDEYFGCHPCVNTSTLKIKISDVLDRFVLHTGHSVTYVTL